MSFQGYTSSGVRSAGAYLLILLMCGGTVAIDSFAPRSVGAHGALSSWQRSTRDRSGGDGSRRRTSRIWSRWRTVARSGTEDESKRSGAWGESADTLASAVPLLDLARRGGGSDASAAPSQRWMGLPLPTLLLSLLVVHKCGTDSLSRFTRNTGVPYSATTVAILGEIVKVPVLVVAICTFEGPGRLRPLLRRALSDSPFQLALPGFAYASQNILYFLALSHVSAASYQLLSQTKLLFTGAFMCLLLGKRLSRSQCLALMLLMGGTVLTQVSEVSRNAQVGGENALLGGALTVLGAALSALPNVYYEKVLKKEGENQWVRNVQLTFWISVFLLLFGVPAMVQSLAGPEAVSLGGMLRGVTPWVYLVTLLQGLKCLIIPATLKHADNILYAYSKPAAILLTAGITAAATGIVPAPSFLAGGALVVASMVMWDS